MLGSHARNPFHLLYRALYIQALRVMGAVLPQMCLEQHLMGHAESPHTVTKTVHIDPAKKCWKQDSGKVRQVWSVSGMLNANPKGLRQLDCTDLLKPKVSELAFAI